MELDIRHWTTSSPDVQALLKIEGATFQECPYSEDELLSLTGNSNLSVWLARVGAKPVGFVSAFSTQGLEGTRWEIDLVAVDPAFRNQGIAQALVQQALTATPSEGTARAWVATDNQSSARAFHRVGFRPTGGAFELWSYEIGGLVPRPAPSSFPSVVAATTGAEIQAWLSGWLNCNPAQAGPVQAERLLGSGNAIWTIERPKAVAGLLALPVQTLHYRGFWIENLWSHSGEESAIAALLDHMVEEAKAMELDDVGIMVPLGTAWRNCLPAQGYGLVAVYRQYRRGPATPAI